MVCLMVRPHYITLSQSYRSTVEIIEFANAALNAQGLGLKSAKPVLRHGRKARGN